MSTEPQPQRAMFSCGHLLRVAIRTARKYVGAATHGIPCVIPPPLKPVCFTPSLHRRSWCACSIDIAACTGSDTSAANSASNRSTRATSASPALRTCDNIRGLTASSSVPLLGRLTVAWFQPRGRHCRRYCKVVETISYCVCASRSAHPSQDRISVYAPRLGSASDFP